MISLGVYYRALDPLLRGGSKGGGEGGEGGRRESSVDRTLLFFSVVVALFGGFEAKGSLSCNALASTQFRERRIEHSLAEIDNLSAGRTGFADSRRQVATDAPIRAEDRHGERSSGRRGLTRPPRPKELNIALSSKCFSDVFRTYVVIFRRRHPRRRNEAPRGKKKKKKEKTLTPCMFHVRARARATP